MSHAFSTVASERARETKAREELRRQQQRVETTEKFSGLRIKNRLVASAVLEDKFADLRFARIPDVKLDMRGRWATAGVLVEKTMKQGSTGSSYSIWKLSDMSPTDYVFTDASEGNVGRAERRLSGHSFLRAMPFGTAMSAEEQNIPSH